MESCFALFGSFAREERGNSRPRRANTVLGTRGKKDLILCVAPGASHPRGCHLDAVVDENLVKVVVEVIHKRYFLRVQRVEARISVAKKFASGEFFKI